MVEIGRRMYEKDLVAASDGNLSILLDDQTILITPTGSCLGYLKSTDLAVINLVKDKLNQIAEHLFIGPGFFN